ncbi:hypothetical protein ILUMI_20390, partial [Ignelater luminosus]
TFVDWKCKTKQKATELIHQQGTGGEPSKFNLNKFEERMMHVIDWSCVEGNGKMNEYGLPVIDK